MVAEIWCLTDGRTDRQKKWHAEVGDPPNKCAEFPEKKNDQTSINLSNIFDFIG